MSIKGKVKWFNGTKGYGFIEREDKEKDVFVHMSAVKDSGVGYLDEGDSLTFEIEEGKKGPSAVNLKKEQVKKFNVGGSVMGIHYDYKSKRGERAMLKEAKRKERLALKKAKRASTSDNEEKSEEVKMHDINKPITLDDLTNPDKQLCNYYPKRMIKNKNLLML